MSSLSHTPRWRRSLDRIPRAKLTINLGDERDNAISLAEFADIARSVQHAIDRIARSLNDSAEQVRQPDLLRRLSTLEAVSIDSRAGVLEIEAPADIEPIAIGSGEEDVGVQAIEIFVHRIGALSRGESPTVEMGQPAEKSLLSFAKAVGGHDRVSVTSQVGGTETVASFVPGLLTAVGIEQVKAPETSDYYTWDFEKALAGVEPIKSIHDLAIPGIDEDEADAFWHAVND